MPSKNIRICSRSFRLKFDKNGGASFQTYSDKGRGEIVIGLKYPDLEEVAEKIVHEAVEAILATDDKRSYNYTGSHEEPNYLFHFDHDYLCSFTYKLVDALVSSGFFKIVDGRK